MGILVPQFHIQATYLTVHCFGRTSQVCEIAPLDPAEVGQDWSMVLSVDEFLVLL